MATPYSKPAVNVVASKVDQRPAVGIHHRRIQAHGGGAVRRGGQGDRERRQRDGIGAIADPLQLSRNSPVRC
jgi:hypothetical protein